ncbi:hypothetical protein [Qipengyuania sphaerica]|uniref:hypothetical protein n=1 Tax=Qipengyuania sphaerica TaxID=2867243 RepID=UPI001C882F4E|nr:hypothetical protein [Qipengyuania sphaerica]MBX7539797.1 hypothetical protein [Qipengyuania sphaerica]
MKFGFAVALAAFVIAGCGETAAREEAPVPAGLEPVEMPAGERVYFDPASRGEGEMNGNPARTGVFVEVFETTDDRWAIRRERWTARCEPQHATKEVLSIQTSSGETVAESSLVIPERDFAARSYYLRSISGYLCGQEVMP